MIRIPYFTDEKINLPKFKWQIWEKIYQSVPRNLLVIN